MVGSITHIFNLKTEVYTVAVKPLIRTSVADGENTADTSVSTNYVGGSPLQIGAGGLSGTLNDTGYLGVALNNRIIDIANGNAGVFVGANKLQIFQGIGGLDENATFDSKLANDTIVPFDTTVSWAVGDQLFIRDQTTHAVWSNFNYDAGAAHGFVTKAPATAQDRLEAWFLS